MAFDSILTQDTTKVEFWLGYHFGMNKMWFPYGHGVVVTPRWCDALISEKWRGEVIVDNGAYSSWVKGEKISLKDQTEGVSDSVKKLLDNGFTIKAAVLPDVVGDGVESYRRSRTSLSELRLMGVPLWTVVQEGSPMNDCVRLADGIFVGGAELEWKYQAAEECVKLGTRVHVGRVSRDHQLHRVAYIGVDSVDSTSPTRSQWANLRTDWISSFKRYCKEVSLIDSVNGSRCVILLSGGVDSSVMLFDLIRNGWDVTALTIDYGQVARSEIASAKALASKAGVDHVVLDVGRFGESILTGGSNGFEVKGRNMMLISNAVSLALKIGANDVMIGSVLDDKVNFPDCRDEFIGGMNSASVYAYGVSVKAPYSSFRKIDVVGIGHVLGIEYSETYSCYTGNVACGMCPSCKLRLKSGIKR